MPKRAPKMPRTVQIPKLIVRRIAKRPSTRLAYQLKLMFTSGPNTGLLTTAAG
jgi:hypothetical protein